MVFIGGKFCPFSNSKRMNTRNKNLNKAKKCTRKTKKFFWLLKWEKLFYITNKCRAIKFVFEQCTQVELKTIATIHGATYPSFHWEIAISKEPCWSSKNIHNICYIWKKSLSYEKEKNKCYTKFHCASVNLWSCWKWNC